MTTRATVEEDILGRFLLVRVARSNPDGSGIVYDYPEPVETWVAPNQQHVEMAGYGPLRLPEEAARALYEALAKFYGGHPETASLRTDYEHERKRVDKFIDHLTGLEG